MRDHNKARYLRQRDSSGRRVGASSQSQDFTKIALQAQIELHRLGDKPKHVSHGHRRNILDHKADDDDQIEARFVLMEYNDSGNKQLKRKMMTRLEAWKRNQTLRGTGFAWALCDSYTKV